MSKSNDTESPGIVDDVWILNVFPVDPNPEEAVIDPRDAVKNADAELFNISVIAFPKPPGLAIEAVTYFLVGVSVSELPVNVIVNTVLLPVLNNIEPVAGTATVGVYDIDAAVSGVVANTTLAVAWE
jgi:hypothetical protein